MEARETERHGEDLGGTWCKCTMFGEKINKNKNLCS